MTVSFAPGGWEAAGFDYAYSWRFAALPKFRQEADCIANSQVPGDPKEFDYMGLLAPQTYTAGAQISVRCSFEDYGAPMLLICDAHEIDKDGILRTLEFYEAVIWKHGLNVWRHHTVNRHTTHYLVLGARFPLAEDEPHTLSAQLKTDRMVFAVDGMSFDLFLHDMLASARLGYCACEGICRLYEMTLR